jgi:probable metal-binding protein
MTRTTPEAAAAARPVIPGHDVLSLIALRGGRCRVAELKSDADRVFGQDALYGNCHGDTFGFDGLLLFLEGKGKLARQGDDLSLGPVPACSGH